MRDSWGRLGLGETPECVKDEGRLKPPFAGNVDIPLAGARRRISRPRRASVLHLRSPEGKFLDILFLTVFLGMGSISNRYRATKREQGSIRELVVMKRRSVVYCVL